MTTNKKNEKILSGYNIKITDVKVIIPDGVFDLSEFLEFRKEKPIFSALIIGNITFESENRTRPFESYAQCDEKYFIFETKDNLRLMISDAK